jgi:hypothetical protein
MRNGRDKMNNMMQKIDVLDYEIFMAEREVREKKEQKADKIKAFIDKHITALRARAKEMHQYEFRARVKCHNAPSCRATYTRIAFSYVSDVKMNRVEVCYVDQYGEVLAWEIPFSPTPEVDKGIVFAAQKNIAEKYKDNL